MQIVDFHIFDAQRLCASKCSNVANYEQIRRVFSTSRTKGVTELLTIGVGALMIQMHWFLVADICLVTAVVWAVLWWEYSNSVYKQVRAKVRAKSRIKPGKDHTVARYRHERSKLWIMRGGGVIFGILATLASLRLVAQFKSNYELDLLYGRLYPANDPDYGPCPVTEGLVNIHVGNGEYQVSDKNFPQVLVGVNDRSVISIDKGSDGALVVLADVRDGTGRLIVRLSKDEFRVNPNNYFAMNHPGRSRSEITVTDQGGNVVLDARYANQHTFIITGRFNAYGVPIILSSDRSVQIGDSAIDTICIRNADKPAGAAIFALRTNAPHGVEQ